MNKVIKQLYKDFANYNTVHIGMGLTMPHTYGDHDLYKAIVCSWFKQI